MINLKLPVFTPSAAKLWAKLSTEDKKGILENVFCGMCRDTTTMFNASGKAEKRLFGFEWSMCGVFVTCRAVC